MVNNSLKRKLYIPTFTLYERDSPAMSHDTVYKIFCVYKLLRRMIIWNVHWRSGSCIHGKRRLKSTVPPIYILAVWKNGVITWHLYTTFSCRQKVSDAGYLCQVSGF